MKSKTRPPPKENQIMYHEKTINLYKILPVSRMGELAPRPFYESERNRMRIINQRRDRSVNFNYVDIYVEVDRIFGVKGDKSKILLGEYDTEERASEVFEEIHKTYKDENIVLMNNIEFADGTDLKQINCNFICSQTDEPTKIEYVNSNIVYYMPTS